MPHRALHAVERLDDLARPGAADEQPVSGEPRQVVGVGRLTQLEHDVVRSVDHVVDGPHAGQQQALGDPARGRGHRHVVEDGHRQAGTEIGRVDLALAASSTGRPLGSGAGGSGNVKGSPSRPARSRAMPEMHQASGRLPSTVMSKTMSRANPAPP